MDFEFKTTVAAPIDRTWELLLDPNIMAGCVPGTQSVEVISDVEYLAEIRVKISFISARFKIKTTIVETRPPAYLRCEGTGEDKAVASAMKQTTELFLADEGGGTTSILVKTKADVLGRLGSFGLSVMKTKADRMWEDFVDNFRAIAEQPESAGAPDPRQAAPDTPTPAASSPARAIPSMPPAARPRRDEEPKGRWWKPWGRAGGRPAFDTAPIAEGRLPTDIYLEVRRGDTLVRVLWPESAAPDAIAWLRDVLK